jgi:RNA polymerase sigma-70 factor (ECF subfamily)
MAHPTVSLNFSSTPQKHKEPLVNRFSSPGVINRKENTESYVLDNLTFYPSTIAKDDQMSDRFMTLVKEERDKAIAIAYHMTSDREAAKDVVQDAFYKAYKALPRFRGESKLSTWFFRILINQAKNYCRRRWLKNRWQSLHLHESQQNTGLDRPSEDPLPDSFAMGAQLRQKIGVTLQRLTANQRAAFGLVHLEGMTVTETAKVLGLSPGTIKSHLHRALKKLRKDLFEFKESQP